MPRNSYDELLAEMQDSWEGSQKDYDQIFGGSSVPESEYLMKPVKLEIAKLPDDRLIIGREHVICDGGEFDGTNVSDIMMLNTDKNKAFVRRYIDQMGYEPPENITEMPDILDSIVADEATVRVMVKKSEGADGTIYTNLRIIEIVDGEETPEEETTEEEEPEEETTEEETPEEEEEEPGEEAADELIARMAAFCATWGIDVDTSDIDAMKAGIENMDYPENLVDDEEKSLLEEIGLEDNITKKEKPKPKPKPVVKKKAVKKAAASKKKVVKKKRK